MIFLFFQVKQKKFLKYFQIFLDWDFDDLKLFSLIHSKCWAGSRFTDQDRRSLGDPDPRIVDRRSIFYFDGSDRFRMNRDRDPAQYCRGFSSGPPSTKMISIGFTLPLDFFKSESNSLILKRVGIFCVAHRCRTRMFRWTNGTKSRTFKNWY